MRTDEGKEEGTVSYISDKVLDRMKGKTIDSVVVTRESNENSRYFNDYVIFKFEDGTEQYFMVEGDCCSFSWIEHSTIPDDIKGALFLGFEELSDSQLGDCPQVDHEGKDVGEYNYVRAYQSMFHTTRGDVVVEYRNESNGYYGGSLEAVKKVYDSQFSDKWHWSRDYGN
jgi:hypothetical protein